MSISVWRIYDKKGAVIGDSPPYQDAYNSAVQKLAAQGYDVAPPGYSESGPSPVPGISNTPTPAPTSIDTQIPIDTGKIEAEGQRQFDQTSSFINQDTIDREAARQRLAQALTKQSQDSFQSSLPQTLEDLNSRHLLNGSGVGQEIARQQSLIAQGILDQTGVLGANDIATTSAQKAAALTGLQGFQTSGLNRSFSLQDFQRQADLSRQIGAMSAPQVGGGKGAVGTTLSGIGSIATPLAYLAGPGAGIAATAANKVVANTSFGPVTRNQTIQGGGK